MPIYSKDLPAIINANTQANQSDTNSQREANLRKFLQQNQQQYETSSAKTKDGYMDEDGDYQRGTAAGAKQAEFQDKSDAEMANLKAIRDSGLANDAAGIKSGDMQIQNDPTVKNAMALSRLGQTQANAYANRAQKTYGPISSGLDTAFATHNALDLNNATGDKAALINETKQVAGDSRGLSRLVTLVGGNPSAFQNATDAGNWLTGQANSGLTDARRQALRDYTNNRVGELMNQKQLADQQMAALGPSTAGGADWNSIQHAYSDPVSQRAQALSKWTAAKSPGAAPAQQGGLAGFFSGFGKSQPQAAPAAAPQAAAPAQPQDPIAAELARRAQAVQSGQQAPGGGQ